MSTRAYYHPRDMQLDLADLPHWLYSELVSLHGHITRERTVLTCLGNQEPMYIYRHPTGRYFAHHYPGGNPDDHEHRIAATMSDEHRRQTEYSQAAAERHGLQTQLEKSTGNSTRLDLAVHGTHQTGWEIQRSQLSRAQAKSRATKSFNAGWPTVWVSDSEHDPDWADHVPTARLTVRGWDVMPPANSVHAIVGQINLERDATRPGGWRYKRTPRQVLLDELVVRVAEADIVATTVGTKGLVMLVDEQSRDALESVTYAGAGQWTPTPQTPRTREAPQRFSLPCKHRAPASNRLGNPQSLRDSRTATDHRQCGCGQRLLAADSHMRGYCEACRIRNREDTSRPRHA